MIAIERAAFTNTLRAGRWHVCGGPRDDQSIVYTARVVSVHTSTPDGFSTPYLIAFV